MFSTSVNISNTGTMTHEHLSKHLKQYQVSRSNYSEFIVDVLPKFKKIKQKLRLCYNLIKAPVVILIKGKKNTFYNNHGRLDMCEDKTNLKP